MELKVVLSSDDNPINQIKESLDILSRIEAAFIKREEITLDFSEVSWILPCSVILISGKIMEILNQGASIKYVPPKDKKVREWLSDIGFPLGKKIDGNTYVSIKHFVNNPEDKNQVNKEANELLKKVKDKIPEEFGSSVQYILGELSDNVDEHSQFTFASLMAQYYPHKEHLDITVLDNGISIPLLFEKNKINFSKDSEAILKAISGEVTTKKQEEMRGYGLKSCKDIAVGGISGELHILSRNGAILIKSKKEPQLYDFEDVGLKGTFLYFRLKTPKKKVNIYPYLNG
jgi:hypothetical protein